MSLEDVDVRRPASTLDQVGVLAIDVALRIQPGGRRPWRHQPGRNCNTSQPTLRRPPIPLPPRRDRLSKLEPRGWRRL